MPARATPDGTAAYAKAHAAGRGHWREGLGLAVSSIGFGSYLGDATDEKDAAYAEAFALGLRGGVNVLDTASIYRGGRSERAVGAAIRAAGVPREAFLVATKAGFLPHDALDRHFRPGTLAPEDVAGGIHAMTPRFLRAELDESLRRLGLDAVDVHFIHNPESQLQGGVPRETFHARLREAFEALEEERRLGRIGAYGLATWNGLRVPPERPEHISLEEALRIAESVGGREHGLRAIELPYNMAMPEAAIEPTQPWRGARLPALQAARDAGLLALGSATLFQTRLLGRVPAYAREALGASSDVEAALQFGRSAPGLTSALVGTGDAAHARENLRAVALPVPGEEAYHSA